LKAPQYWLSSTIFCSYLFIRGYFSALAPADFKIEYYQEFFPLDDSLMLLNIAIPPPLVVEQKKPDQQQLYL
jgi:hypothetical protein